MTMREILFRGKRVKPVALVSQWILGNYVFKADGSLPGLGKHFIVVHDGFGLSQWVEVIPETMGQYTGLTDKNGKKIFEGDIVRAVLQKSNAIQEFVWPNMVVGFCEGTFAAMRGKYCTPLNSFAPAVELEVIGNIHDNPELMEGENHG